MKMRGASRQQGHGRLVDQITVLERSLGVEESVTSGIQDEQLSRKPADVASSRDRGKPRA